MLLDVVSNSLIFIATLYSMVHEKTLQLFHLLVGGPLACLLFLLLYFMDVNQEQ